MPSSLYLLCQHKRKSTHVLMGMRSLTSERSCYQTRQEGGTVQVAAPGARHGSDTV